MKNIGMRITAVMVIAIIITMGVATFLGVLAIRSIGRSDSDQMLLLLGESGKDELDDYFESVEQAVEIEAAYAESDLEYRGLENLSEHVEWARGIFSRLANRTGGVLTYYYRIDPSVSDTEKGFWYVNLDGKGFTEHEVTDITLYDTDDTSSLVWFTVPKYEGKPVWLPPYITDNLDVRVISYNVPIYWHDTFIGVLGIEIDYATMAAAVDRISFHDSGYAFVVDSESRLVYHPHMDIPAMEVLPETPEGLYDGEKFMEYTFEGVSKRAVELGLENGMRLVVSVPVNELNARWQGWVYQIVSISLVLLVSAILMFVYILHAIQKQKDSEERRVKLEGELKSASELVDLMSSLSSLLTNIPAMAFTKDAATGVYLACNQALADYSGKRSPEEVIGRTDYDIYDSKTAEHFVYKDKLALEKDKAYVYFEDVLDRDGKTIRNLQTTKMKYTDQTGRLCIIGICVDVTETAKAKAAEAAAEVRMHEEKQKKAIEENYRKKVDNLNYKASHDELTGVLNRAGYDVLMSSLDIDRICLALIDADDFKNVNDCYGHETGDRILVKIADSLRRNFRQTDSICRMGGDEFVVIMQRGKNDLHLLISAAVDEINRELSDVSDGLPPISISVGVADGGQASDPVTLFEYADRAMYECKREGKNGYRFYAPEG